MKPTEKARLAAEKATQLYERWHSCNLCPRDCQVNRLEGQTGYCGAGKGLLVYTAFLHRGEEPGITGKGGSGTVFFSACNLKCVYCQNYRFSHSLEENRAFVQAAGALPEKGQWKARSSPSFEGNMITSGDLAEIMLNLQGKGAENINLVTPTHFLPPILEALSVAFQKGLNLPLVYNTSGYEKEETIEILDGIVDIYLADMRYITPSVARRYSNAPDYPGANKRSLRRMYRQKRTRWEGELLKEGLVIRHLVLPGHAEECTKVLSWVKQCLPQAIISLMFQYQPYFKASVYPEINRRVSEAEYRRVTGFLDTLDLNGWAQELSPEEGLAGVHFTPSLHGFL